MAAKVFKEAGRAHFRGIGVATTTRSTIGIAMWRRMWIPGGELEGSR